MMKTKSELLAQAEALEWAANLTIGPIQTESWPALSSYFRAIRGHAISLRDQAATMPDTPLVPSGQWLAQRVNEVDAKFQADFPDPPALGENKQLLDAYKVSQRPLDADIAKVLSTHGHELYESQRADNSEGSISRATDSQESPAVEREVGLPGPVAWLHVCKKPGQTIEFATVDPDDNSWWPADQWTSHTVTPLVSKHAQIARIERLNANLIAADARVVELEGLLQKGIDAGIFHHFPIFRRVADAAIAKGK